jgi:cysteinyl-tRNA synthetase
VHYRKPLNYSEEALNTAKNTVKKINTFICRLGAIDNSGDGFTTEVDQLIYDLKHNFLTALDDDLNISGAMAALFNFIGKINSLLVQAMIKKDDAQKILTALKNIDEVLGIMDFTAQIAHGEIVELIKKREVARKRSNWQEADSLRAELDKLGVDILDTPQGAIWRSK